MLEQLPGRQDRREGNRTRRQRHPFDARRIAAAEAQQCDAYLRQQGDDGDGLEEDGTARRRPGRLGSREENGSA